jgi:hypothetical protein
MDNKSGQHLGDELLGADEDDTVEGVPDVREESAVDYPKDHKSKPQTKQGEETGKKITQYCCVNISAS